MTQVLRLWLTPAGDAEIRVRDEDPNLPASWFGPMKAMAAPGGQTLGIYEGTPQGLVQAKREWPNAESFIRCVRDYGSRRFECDPETGEILDENERIQAAGLNRSFEINIEE